MAYMLHAYNLIIYFNHCGQHEELLPSTRTRH